MKRDINMDKAVEINEYMADAEECLQSAVYTANGGFNKTSLNRSYYCIYNAMCACLLCVDFPDHKHHSTVIAKFRELLIKPGYLNKELSAIIDDLSENRNNSDYTKGFRASKSEAKECIDKAKLFYEAVKKYIDGWLEGSFDYGDKI